MEGRGGIFWGRAEGWRVGAETVVDHERRVSWRAVGIVFALVRRLCYTEYWHSPHVHVYAGASVGAILTGGPV